MVEVAIDHVNIEGKSKFPYLLVARCTFSGWIEAFPTKTTESKKVIKLLSSIFSRHGFVLRVIADSGTTSAMEVREFVENLGISFQKTMAQNLTGNAVVERGHQPLLAALSRICHDKTLQWWTHLDKVLWADRIMVRVL